jgi:hypothetical protein
MTNYLFFKHRQTINDHARPQLTLLPQPPDAGDAPPLSFVQSCLRASDMTYRAVVKQLPGFERYSKHINMQYDLRTST